MAVTRREFGLLAAGAGAAGIGALGSGGAARADVILPPAIIAEGGAAEERIEDTHSALDLAIDQGCDFIQLNFFPTREGALVARRESELSKSTNVAALPRFADRKTTKTIDGQPVTGWFVEDFTLDEMKTLLCREALPALRPQNLRYDDKEPVLDIGDVLQIARDGCVRTARTVGVCARLIRVKAFEDQGLDVVGRLASELSTAGYVSPAAAIWVQAFEPGPLQAFGRVSPIRRMQLVRADASPDSPFAQMTSSDGLAAIHGYADAIGPDQDLLIDPNAAAFPAPTTLALDAHNAGLKVFSHTARGENAFLPPALRRGDSQEASFPAERGDVGRLLGALFSDAIDGVATDLPGEALRARKAVVRAVERARAAAGGGG